MEKNIVSLKSSDGHILKVGKIVVDRSKMIQSQLEEGDGSSVNDMIILPINSKILAKIIEYCNYHHYHDHHHDDASESSSGIIIIEDNNNNEDDLKKFDEKFVDVDWETLKGIILASHYMNINDLEKLGIKAAADYIKDKSVEEVRELFNIKNDFTPEEEAAILKNHDWVLKSFA